MHTDELNPQFTQRTMRANVVAAKLGVAEPTIWRWINTGGFPKPLILSPGVTAWYEHEVDAWLASRAQLRDAESHAT